MNFELGWINRNSDCFYRYFDEEEESEENMAYQPAPGSPGTQEEGNSGEEEDPLDAFMSDIDREVGI